MFYIRFYMLYGVHSVHYLQLNHDMKPTKCTNMFLRYLYYNITLYRVSIKSFPDYKHLLQENYVE